MKAHPTAIVLIGPTATGKSELALLLAERFPLEIVNLDSAQVYRDMDIGTAKPDAATRSRIPHHLLDLVTPEESYSCARYRQDALAVIGEIRARGRIPLLVGGTMLYYQTLVGGLSPLPAADPRLRAEIDADARRRGWPALHAELARLDPLTAARLSPHDAQRIQRALEVFHLSGQPMSALLSRPTEKKLAKQLLTIALGVEDRTLLAARIRQRFQAMLAAGFVEEVETLRARYRLSAHSAAMRCVGYRQVFQMLAGEFPPAELVERGSTATRQLAKRQLTWLRSFQEKGMIDHLFDFAERELAAKIASVLDPLLARTAA